MKRQNKRSRRPALRRLRWLALLIIPVVLNLAARPVGATSAIRVPVDILAKMATAIVQIQTEAVDATDTKVLVVQSYDGPLAAGQEVLVHQPGPENGRGELGDSPYATFYKGEKGVVFLEQDDKGRWIVTAGFQGKFEIVSDFRGVPVVESRAVGEVGYSTDAEGEGPRVRELTVFAADIQKFVAWKHEAVRWAR